LLKNPPHLVRISLDMFVEVNPGYW